MPLQNTECLVPISDVGFFPAKLVHPAERLIVQVASGEDWLCRWQLTKQQGQNESVTWESPPSYGIMHEDMPSNRASADAQPRRRQKTSAERRKKFRDALAGYSKEQTSSHEHESVGIPQKQQMGLGTPLGFAAKGVSADQLEAFKERLQQAGGHESNTRDIRDVGGLVAAAPPGVDVVEVGPGRHVLRSKGDARSTAGGVTSDPLPQQAGGEENDEIVEIRETEEQATIQGTRGGRGRAGQGSGGHAIAAAGHPTMGATGSGESKRSDEQQVLQPLPAGAAASSPDPPLPSASAPASAHASALSSRLDALEAAEERARAAAGGAGTAEWDASLLDLDQERRRARARELEGAQRWAERVLKQGGGVTSEAGAVGPAHGTQRRVPGTLAPAREPASNAAPVAAPAPASAPSQHRRSGSAGASLVQAPSLPASVTSEHAAPRPRSRPRSIIGDVVERRPVATAVPLGAEGSPSGAAALGAGAPRMSKFRAARLARQQGRG